MNKRVSTSVGPILKFFMSTVPFGKSQSPLAPTVMFCPLGSAIQRSFTAPSDQNGAFTA